MNTKKWTLKPVSLTTIFAATTFLKIVMKTGRDNVYSEL